MDVIIPTTGKRPKQLLECLQSLSKQTQPINVIIVFSKIIKNDDVMQYLYNMKNCSILYEPYKKAKGSHRAIACNNGLCLSQSEYVAFLDDDVTVPPTWAQSALKYFKNSEVAGVTSGSVPSTTPYHLVQTIGSDAHSKSFTKLTEVESIPGFNSVYRKQALLQVGFFNEEIGGCEDWELNYRLRKAGWKLYGIPETSVEHRHTYTLRSFIKQMFGYGWSRSRLFRIKHIFTIQHAIPTVGLLIMTTLLFTTFPILFGLIIVYLLFLGFLTFKTKSSNFKLYVQTYFIFLTMHLSWALGYLKGLIE